MFLLVKEYYYVISCGVLGIKEPVSYLYQPSVKRKKSALLLRSFSLISATLRMWCISTDNELPQIRHILFRLVFVIFLAQEVVFFSNGIGLFIWNAWVLWKVIGKNNFFFVFGQDKCEPNFLKAFDAKRSLYFNARVREQESFIPWTHDPKLLWLSTNE